MKEVFLDLIKHLEDGDREAAAKLLAEKREFMDREAVLASLDARMLLDQIDHYLNNEAVVITGAITLDDIKRAYIELFGSDGNNS